VGDAPNPQARTRGRILWTIARIVLGSYLLWCLVLSACQTSMIFPRDLAGTPFTEGAMPRGIERWWVTAADGSKVEAWFLAPPLDATERSGPAPAVIIFHGNAELIDHISDYADWYRRRGYAVLVPEYRGYGRSAGTPSQAAITEDMLAFEAKLVARPEVDPKRVIYHGRSLGSAVAAQLSERKPPAALVLEAPFLSINAMAARYFVPGFIVKHPFRTDKVLPALNRPVLILHSTDDEIVPYSHGAKLHKLTPGSRLIDLSGSHNSALASLPQYWSSIDAFLNENVAPPPQ
jgi:fermentation-respiration switch protein FrsA (DUF1100 family)